MDCITDPGSDSTVVPVTGSQEPNQNNQHPLPGLDMASMVQQQQQQQQQGNLISAVAKNSNSLIDLIHSFSYTMQNEIGMNGLSYLPYKCLVI